MTRLEALEALSPALPPESSAWVEAPLAKDDLLVIQVNGSLTREQAEHIKRTAEGVISQVGAKCIVLTDGVRLTVERGIATIRTHGEAQPRNGRRPVGMTEPGEPDY